MSFLFPLYLLGAAALAVPILLHLRRRPPKEHMEFSSLMFLEKSPEQLTRRTRIDRWLLLALRCLALLLLALIFCRPYFKSTTFLGDGGTGTRTAILIDRSASMQREGLWEEALKLANDAISKTGANDSVSVAVFSQNLETINPAENTVGWTGSARKDELTKLLADSKPGWSATDLGTAISELADETSSESSEGKDAFAKREVVVISDFQDGAKRDALAQYAWPEDVSVRCLSVSPKTPGNLTANLVAASVTSDRQKSGPVTRRVRLSNSQDSESENYQLKWAGEDGGKIAEGILPPGASRVVAVPQRESESEDAVLEISGDAHSFDNKVYITRTQPRLIQILFVGEDPKRNDVGSSYFYLARAMNRTKAIDPTVAGIKFEDFKADSLKTANVVVVQLSEKTPAAVADSVGNFVADGGMAIAITGEGATAETLATLSGQENLKLSEAEVSSYAMLSSLDFEHPVLAPFAKAKVRDFTKVHTWKHRSLTIPEDDETLKRLASFENGDPAWLEMNRGQKNGRLFVFTSGWEPQESQLALSSKFVPLIYAMLAQAGYSATEAKPLYVGDLIPLAGIRNAKTMKLPTGNSVSLDADSTVFAETNEPGFYTVATSTVGEERVFAVNLSPAESRIEAVDPVVALGDLGVNIETQTEESPESALAGATKEEIKKQQQRLEAEEKEKRQKVWKWIVLAILIVLLIETWLAGRRRTDSTKPEAATVAG